MPLYLTVSQGPRADRTQPILVVSDKRVIATVMREIGNLAEAETPRNNDDRDAIPALTLLPKREQ